MMINYTGAYREPLVYALLAFVLYSANLRVIGSGDTLPARFLPFALLGHGTVLLDPVADAARQEVPTPYWLQRTRTGHTASLFPIVTPVLVTPLYLPAVAYLSAAGWTEPRFRAVGAIMEKLSASLIAGASVALMFVLLRRSTNQRDARLLALAFAAGTTTWAISSQALWQHGVGQLSLLVAIVAMTGAPTRASAVFAGCATGILAANRPLDGLFAIALALYAWKWAGPRLAVFALSAVTPVVLNVAYGLWAFGNVWGGYGATGHFTLAYFSRPVLEGMVGLLVSPGKGLLVYSPFLLWLVTAPPWRAHPYAPLIARLSVAVALQIVLYGAIDWRAGHSYGTRFLTDAIPVLIWLLVVPLAALRRRHAFVAAVALAIGVQAIGAFKYSGKSDLIMYAPGQRSQFERAWRVADSPILFEARQPFARMTLLDEWRTLGRDGP